ncbi:hypothetical protein [Bradyrhizobium sp.]|uniref:hypothetical protein n=1 Tax=Bradyrhizobium sp. TaxID=376 RepID=UPI0025B924BF|nr:hypothetical protein [Bradyrhizobium sp.]
MNERAGVDIERMTTATDDVRLLIGELDQVLAANTRPSSGTGWRCRRCSSRTFFSSWRG